MVDDMLDQFIGKNLVRDGRKVFVRQRPVQKIFPGRANGLDPIDPQVPDPFDR